MAKYEWVRVAVTTTIPRKEIEETAARLGMTVDEYLSKLARAFG